MASWLVESNHDGAKLKLDVLLSLIYCMFLKAFTTLWAQR